MAFLTDTLSARGTLGEKLAAFWAAYLEGAAKRAAFRQTMRELNTLSDRELADLGLHRSGLRRIAYQAAYES